MKNFPVKSDLPNSSQVELDRVSAIPSGQRTATEAAFIAALDTYLHNEITRLDSEGNVKECAGNYRPQDGLDGSSKGCQFTKKNAADKGLYENQGTSASCDFNLIGEITSSEIADGAVTTDKLGNTAVTESKIGAGAVTIAKIGSGAATKTKIGYKAVSVQVDAGLDTGASADDPTLEGGALLGVIPVLQDIELETVGLSASGAVNITMVGATTDTNQFTVNVLKP